MAHFSITTAALSLNGTREKLTFFCPDHGGYVRNSDTHQLVCARLQSRGWTLSANADTLPTVIRTELRRLRADLAHDRRNNSAWA